MPIDDATRVRVVRALLGMSSKEFAQKIGISQGCITSWEHGRTAPQGPHRHELAKLCHERKIGMLPSGMPVPFTDVLMFREMEQK